VFVEGAEPGDTLEVKILSIDFALDYGYNGCSGFLPENCDRSVPQKIIPLDRKRMTAEFKPGIVIPLRPFFGSMGVAPAADAGRVSSNPPGRHAGNLDNKELVAGSTLLIPAPVPGGPLRSRRYAMATAKSIRPPLHPPAAAHHRAAGMA
jgi:acetamidase/formamidase